MTTIRVLLASMVLLAVGSCCETRDRMAQKCEDDCFSYGYSPVRAKATCGDSRSCCESEDEYECWCRRTVMGSSTVEEPCTEIDTERGTICKRTVTPVGGYEPVRIW